MIIYENNLHEKLAGLAISRDYLKYNTPFCDMVDDPYWALDIDLALNYNSAINGDLNAANKLVQDLTLNSSVLDGSTLEFYVHKINYNPVFRSAIREMRARWSTPNMFSDSFQNLLLQALKDCLNSPCNLFTETSDSIGRLVQATAGKTATTSFGVGELSASFINMYNGLDDTITESIPQIFKNAYTEVTQASTQAWSKVQGVLAGKENLQTFNQKIRGGQDLRDPSQVFRYTPDVKSNYDQSIASSNGLTKIREKLGGCFGKFEYNFRRNPYNGNTNNRSPIGMSTLNVNGRQIDALNGEPRRSNKNNKANLERRTSIKPSPQQALGDLLGTSTIYTLNSTGNRRYTVFAAYVDKDKQIIFTDPYEKHAYDRNTRAGLGSIGPDHIYAPSHIAKTTAGYRVFAGEDLPSNVDQANTTAYYYANKWDHDLSVTSMETLYSKAAGDKIYNDGVAISNKLLQDYLGNTEALDALKKDDKDARFKMLRDSGIHAYMEKNQAFVAVRPAGKGNNDWLYFKIISLNSLDDYIVDFTCGAWKFLMGEIGGSELIESGKTEIPNTGGWSEVEKAGAGEYEGPLEVRLCFGTLDGIKANMSGDPGDLPSLEDELGGLEERGGGSTGTGFLPGQQDLANARSTQLSVEQIEERDKDVDLEGYINEKENLPQEKADAPAAPAPLTYEELLQIENMTPEQEKLFQRLLNERNRNLPPNPLL